jgi:putative peptidyl-prolyl cis-trans isomerase
MKKTSIGIVLAAALVSLPVSTLSAWETYDRVLAVVNDYPIVESEVEMKFARYSKGKKITRGKLDYEKSRILDSYIDDALFAQTAEEESIIVSEKKIDNFIESAMKRMNIKTVDEFKKKLQSQDRISWEDYRDELRRSMTRELVMSIAVGLAPPSQDAARQWYEKNRGKIGYEYNVKHILMRPRGSSMAEEKKVSQKLNEIRSRIRGGASFESMAQQYSEDAETKGSGGSLGWVKLSDIDRFLAMQIYMMSRPGQVSDVVKSGDGYHIFKMLGKRVVPYESVKGIIFNILYSQNLGKQVESWAVRKKKESDIVQLIRFKS